MGKGEVDYENGKEKRTQNLRIEKQAQGQFTKFEVKIDSKKDLTNYLHFVSPIQSERQIDQEEDRLNVRTFLTSQPLTNCPTYPVNKAHSSLLIFHVRIFYNLMSNRDNIFLRDNVRNFRSFRVRG